MIEHSTYRAIQFRRTRILIVHKEPLVRDLVTSALEMLRTVWDVSAVITSSPEEAVTRAQSSRIPIAAVVLPLDVEPSFHEAMLLLRPHLSPGAEALVLVPSDADLTRIHVSPTGSVLPFVREPGHGSASASEFVQRCTTHLSAIIGQCQLARSNAAIRGLLAHATSRDDLHSITCQYLVLLASCHNADVCLFVDLLNDPTLDLAVVLSALIEGFLAREVFSNTVNQMRLTAIGHHSGLVSKRASDHQDALDSFLDTAHIVKTLDGDASSAEMTGFEYRTINDRPAWISLAYGLQGTLVSALVVSPRGRDAFDASELTSFAEFFETWAVQHERLTVAEVRTQDARSRNEARQSRQNEIVQMVAGVAHEINTPLGVIHTASHIIEQKLGTFRELDDQPGIADSIDDLDSALRMIKSNTLRLHGLVDRFKGIAVTQNLDKPKVVEIGQPLRHAVGRIFARHGSLLSINIIEDVDPDCIEWCGHPRLLEEVLASLMDNAAQHAYQGGAGLVELYLRGRSIAGRAHYSVAVTDFGAGIKPDERARVFDAFFTTDRIRKATGLGLAVVKSMVEDGLHGQIHCDSTPGIGTTFVVDFVTTTDETDSPSD